MKRYKPNLCRFPGEPYLYEDEEGGYVLWSEVVDLLTDIHDSWTLEEAKNYVIPKLNEATLNETLGYYV